MRVALAGVFGRDDSMIGFETNSRLKAAFRAFSTICTFCMLNASTEAAWAEPAPAPTLSAPTANRAPNAPVALDATLDSRLGELLRRRKLRGVVARLDGDSKT